MGNYNDYYQRYYSSMPKSMSKVNMDKKNSTSNSHGYNYGQNMRNSNTKGSYFENLANKFIAQLMVAVVLSIIFFSCKTFDNTYTRNIIGYSKKVIEKSYNYEIFINKIQDLKINDIEEKSIMLIEKIKSSITGGLTLQDEIKKQYTLPVSLNSLKQGNDLSLLAQGVNKDNILWVKLDTESNINACQKGKVKKTGKDETYGNYIIIDHGKGIETKYSNVSEITIKLGDEVEKGQVIAKVTPNSPNFQTFYFELLYMGKRENILDYLEI